ncbi:MAG: ABC transporter ATP-binding protein [Lachnospiraceae bacterium]
MILEVKNLNFSYHKKKPVFADVNFTLNQGETLTILGPNGAGKSTLLNCLANVLTPTGGDIFLEGKNIRETSLQDVARILGYVPQSHTPAYGYSVRDFVVMGRAPYLGMFQKPGRDDYALADRVIDQMNLTKLADQPYTEISGGERQQAAIARAIVQQPKIIMFDEPTNHLDYGNQLRTVKMIKNLADQGYAVIMTTHMPDHAILLGGKVAMLDYSGKLLVGEAGEILEEGLLKRIYRSDLHILYLEEVGRKVCVAGNLDTE